MDGDMPIYEPGLQDLQHVTATAYNISRHMVDYKVRNPEFLKEGALEGADALVIVTEWQEFRSPDSDAIKAQLKNVVIFDGHNLYDPTLVRGQELEYLAIDR